MSIKKVTTKNGETRWLVRVYESGRGSKQIGRNFEKKSEAEDWLMDFKKKKAEEKRNPFSTISFEGKIFSVEAEYWLLNAKMRVSPGHIVKSEALIKEFIERFGDLPIERLTPEFLTRFQMSESQKGNKNATVNRKTEIVTAILNHSVRHRRIPFSPATGFKKLPKDQKEMASWDQEEALSFLEAMNEKYPVGSDDRWVYLVYLLTLNTGLRAGEVWGIKPSDLVEATNTITVRRQFHRIENEFCLPKGKKMRVAPCNPSLMKELKDWIALTNNTDDKTIFFNENGKPICHDNFAKRRYFKDLKSWGGRPIRFHDMRHTATTLLISANVDLKTVKEICGHADISTTMNYVHLVNGAIEKVAKTFSLNPENKEVNRNLKLVK